METPELQDLVKPCANKSSFKLCLLCPYYVMGLGCYCPGTSWCTQTPYATLSSRKEMNTPGNSSIGFF